MGGVRLLNGCVGETAGETSLLDPFIEGRQRVDDLHSLDADRDYALEKIDDVAGLLVFFGPVVRVVGDITTQVVGWT